MKDTGKAREIGIDWSIKQSKELIASGHKHLHYFVMNDADAIIQVLEGISQI